MATYSLSESLNGSYAHTNTVGLPNGNEPSTSKGTDLTTPLNPDNIGAVLTRISQKVCEHWEDIGFALHMEVNTISSLEARYRDPKPAFEAMINHWVESATYNTHTLGDLMKALKEVNDLTSAVFQDLNQMLQSENIFSTPDLQADTSTQSIDNEVRQKVLWTLFTEHNHLLNEVNINFKELGRGLGLNRSDLAGIESEVHSHNERKQKVVLKWLQKQGNAVGIEQLEAALKNNQRIAYMQKLREKYDELLLIESSGCTTQKQKECITEMSQQITQLKQANARLTTQHSQFQQEITKINDEMKVQLESRSVCVECLQRKLQAQEQLHQQLHQQYQQLHQQFKQTEYDLQQVNIEYDMLKRSNDELKNRERILNNRFFECPSSRYQTTPTPNPLSEKQTSTEQAAVSVPISPAVSEQDEFMKAFSDTERGNRVANMHMLTRAGNGDLFNYTYWSTLADKLGFNENFIDCTYKHARNPKACWMAVNKKFLNSGANKTGDKTYRAYAKAVYDTYCEKGKQQDAVTVGIRFLDAANNHS